MAAGNNAALEGMRAVYSACCRQRRPRERPDGAVLAWDEHTLERCGWTTKDHLSVFGYESVVWSIAQQQAQPLPGPFAVFATVLVFAPKIEIQPSVLRIARKARTGLGCLARVRPVDRRHFRFVFDN